MTFSSYETSCVNIATYGETIQTQNRDVLKI
jgi:hypothetical protein